MTNGTIIKAYALDELYLVLVDDIICGFYNSEQLSSLIKSSEPCYVKYYSFELYSHKEYTI